LNCFGKLIKMNDSKELWERTIISTTANIERAVNILNDTSLKIVLVTNLAGELIGTISDGDIRRGLLKGLNLASPIESIIHHDALVVPPKLSRETVVQLMTANKIQQIPIVDEQMHVVGLHLWDEISKPLAISNTMVIMAGGKGTRLHPQTENCPKPMLLVEGKPILEHIIDRAKVEGFSHFVLAVYHLGHMIEDYFGDGKRFGVEIEYLREESPLGTAGALSLLSPVPDSAFIVTNGDVISDIHYGELLDFHQRNNAMATMAVRMHEWQNPFGVVETKGIEIIGYEEKPIYRSQINAGVYVMEPLVIGMLTKAVSCDMPTLFELIQKKEKKVIAYPIHEKWLDIGRPDELLKAKKLDQSRANKIER
jgi:dTDP-glucose pyrophosphorylase